jgi:DNA-binding GntR family transcriptional regulator
VTAFQRPPTAQEAVLVELRGRILRGELPPGTPLRQEVLAASLGVSRVPIREALRMLESEGHVAYAAHRGYRVAELSLADLEELYALRGLLEDHLAGLAMARMGEHDRAQVRGAHAELEAAEAAALPARAAPAPFPAGHSSGPPDAPAAARPAAPADSHAALAPAPADSHAALGPAPADSHAALAAANRAFHWAILRPTPRAHRMLTTLWDASDAYRARWFADPVNVARGAEDHRAILAAVEAGDGPRVVSLLAAHRDAAITALRAALPR